MVFSYAWGDVHIVTYNGLIYDFQGDGEFTLAKSRIPGDTFRHPDAPARLVHAGASVTLITSGRGQSRHRQGDVRSAFAIPIRFVDGKPSTMCEPIRSPT